MAEAIVHSQCLSSYHLPEFIQSVKHTFPFLFVPQKVLGSCLKNLYFLSCSSQTPQLYIPFLLQMQHSTGHMIISQYPRKSTNTRLAVLYKPKQHRMLFPLLSTIVFSMDYKLCSCIFCLAYSSL